MPKQATEKRAVDQFAELLEQTGWHCLRVAKDEQEGFIPVTFEAWAKNGRLMLVQSFPDGGYECCFPTPLARHANIVAQANAYAEGVNIFTVEADR